MKRQRFQLKNYESGETATINWNTGSDYVKQYNSYLTFTLKLTGTSTPTANFARNEMNEITKNNPIGD